MTTPKEVWTALSPRDRKQVASVDFRDGKFLQDGEIDCICGACNKGWRRDGFGSPFYDPCSRIEFLCEIMAVVILVPAVPPNCGKVIAKAYDVDCWTLRLRRAIGDTPQ